MIDAAARFYLHLLELRAANARARDDGALSPRPPELIHVSGNLLVDGALWSAREGLGRVSE